MAYRQYEKNKLNKDEADEFIDWIQTADEEEMQRVLLVGPGPEPQRIIQNDIDLMQHARNNKIQITDVSTIKRGSPRPGHEEMFRIKFEWHGLSYDIKWTPLIEATMKARKRDRKIEEILRVAEPPQASGSK